MAEYGFDHVHLRSRDLEGTAAFYQRMFGAEVIRSTLPNGTPRIEMKLGGLTVLIGAATDPKTQEAPHSPYLGMEHFGLRVDDLDAAAAELRARGAVFDMEPTPVRAGLKIAFLRGPENVCIELLQRG
jgi:catechol 2,3-dioxygenase-like lactoylglutathione lyase family enzyme